MPLEIYGNAALELELRKKIYEVVNENAGCHFREIERRSMMASGTVRYHLNYLVKKGIISESKDVNTIRYFPEGFTYSDKGMLVLLRQKSMRNILLFILTHDKCSHEQIVEKVHVSPSTVSWHLRKLENMHTIQSERKGRNTFYTVLADKQDIINLLIAYKKSFFDAMVDNVGKLSSFQKSQVEKIRMWIFFESLRVELFYVLFCVLEIIISEKKQNFGRIICIPLYALGV